MGWIDRKWRTAAREIDSVPVGGGCRTETGSVK
jgi:hypothetical protein